jgi:hypothetical protein
MRGHMITDQLRVCLALSLQARAAEYSITSCKPIYSHAMWLINVHSYALEEFLGEGETPPYAIISHVWSRPASAEVTF